MQTQGAEHGENDIDRRRLRQLGGQKIHLIISDVTCPTWMASRW